MELCKISNGGCLCDAKGVGFDINFSLGKPINEFCRFCGVRIDFLDVTFTPHEMASSNYVWLAAEGACAICDSEEFLKFFLWLLGLHL